CRRIGCTGLGSSRRIVLAPADHGRHGDDDRHGPCHDPGPPAAPPFLEFVLADGLVDFMKGGGIGQRWLPDYREISTASGAVHRPATDLWQTMQGRPFGGALPFPA